MHGIILKRIDSKFQIVENPSQRSNKYNNNLWSILSYLYFIKFAFLRG